MKDFFEITEKSSCAPRTRALNYLLIMSYETRHNTQTGRQTKAGLMKTISLIIALVAASCLAQTEPTIEWQKCLGGIHDDMARSISQTADGGFIVAGCSHSNDGDVSGNHGFDDYWVVKLNSSGDIQWQNSLGGSDDDRAFSIEQTTDGGFIVAGESESNDSDVTGNHGDYDCWVVKLNSSGVIQWQKSLGGSDEERVHSISQTADGGFIVAGYSESNDGDVSGNHGGRDYWVVKLNSSGNIQWQKCLGGSYDDRACSISQAADSGFIVAGYSISNDGNVSGNHGGYDYWVVKLNSSGDIDWQKSLGGSDGDAAHSISQTADGGFIVAGYSWSNDGDVSGNHGNQDYWVAKLNSSSDIQWQDCLGGSYDDWAYSISQAVDGGFIVAGKTESNNGNVSGYHGGLSDYWVLKLNSSGVLEWQKCLGGNSWDEAKSISQTADGGFIVAGFSYSNNGDVSGNHGVTDYWVVKLSPETGITENFTPEAFTISTYPNPFNSAVSITAPAGAEIEIFDIEGRMVDVIARPEAAAISSIQGDCFGGQSPSRNDGKGEFTWQPSPSIGSGIYLVRAIRGEQEVTKRIVYLK